MDDDLRARLESCVHRVLPPIQEGLESRLAFVFTPDDREAIAFALGQAFAEGAGFSGVDCAFQLAEQGVGVTLQYLQPEIDAPDFDE